MRSPWVDTYPTSRTKAGSGYSCEANLRRESERQQKHRNTTTNGGSKVRRILIICGRRRVPADIVDPPATSLPHSFEPLFVRAISASVANVFEQNHNA